MDDLDLIIDLHREGARQGPGGGEETRLAARLGGLAGRRGLKIADIGCGTGAAALELARDLDAEVTCVEFLAPLLEILESRARAAGIEGRIETLCRSMDDLPFADASLDAIWSEGAIYNMGFEAGIKAWRRFLKPGGVLAVTDPTWFTRERPEALDRHWREAYPGVATASEKLAALEAAGYAPLGYFPLPEACWLENYYRPLQARFPAFLEQYEHREAARACVEAEEHEIALYERNKAFISYGFYVARKV